MSGDALCLGMCMMDWDAGVCLGCGRSAEEIDNAASAQVPEPGTETPAAERSEDDAAAGER